MLAAMVDLVRRAEVWRHLHRMHAGWLLGALALLLLQFVVMAGRWCFFARVLSAPLHYRQALGEYFLAGFLNQMLPLGVLGDVTRALRHARTLQGIQPRGRVIERAALAIALERGSGQLALWLVVAAILPSWWMSIRPSPGHAFAIGTLATLFLALIAVAWVVWQRRMRPESRRMVGAGWNAMLASRSLSLHLPLSLFLVVIHTLVFVTIAHGLGLRLPLLLGIRVVPLVLVATTIPLFVAGWGAREATLAGLYHLAGLHESEGVTIALVYGCLSVLATLPGLWAFRGRHATRIGDGDRGLPDYGTTTSSAVISS